MNFGLKTQNMIHGNMGDETSKNEKLWKVLLSVDLVFACYFISMNVCLWWIKGLKI